MRTFPFIRQGDGVAVYTFSPLDIEAKRGICQRCGSDENQPMAVGQVA